jgi:hypothetical protein
MKSVLGIGIVVAALALGSLQAHAQRRVGNAAMGALAGAVVAGPIGLVAGGAIGYTAGEDIARGMGIKRRRHHRHHRHYN